MSEPIVERKRKTHCIKGHKFDGTEQWQTNWKGYQCRVCRECAKIRMRRKRENPDFRANEADKMRRWRAENPERNALNWKTNRRNKKEWLDSFKIGCSRCGETHIACLEFHHRNPNEKDFLLSVGVAKYSVKRLEAEVAKCEVICSNCHRKHHWQEKQDRLRPTE